MGFRPIMALLLISVLLLSGVSIAKTSPLSPPSLNNLENDKIIEDNDATAVLVTPADSSSPYKKNSFEIRDLVRSKEISKEVLVENNIVSDSLKESKPRSSFTGKVKVYNNDELVNSDTYVKGFKLDAIALEELEVPQENIIKECQPITSPGIYTLDRPVSSYKTCFEIMSDKVLLDCNGYEIIYATEKPGSAVKSYGNNVVAIKNCEIAQIDGRIANSPAIDIQSGTKIVVANNIITTRATESEGISLMKVGDATILGNEINTEQRESKGILLSWAKNSLIKNNDIITNRDLSPGIYLSNVITSIINSNRISTSGDISDAIFTSFSGRNGYLNNKIETLGDNSNAFSIYGQALGNLFKTNHIYRATGDAFKFDSGESIVDQNDNTLTSNKLENVDGLDLNLEQTTPKSYITLISQAVTGYILPEEAGIFATIKRPIYGEIEFTEPISGSGDNGVGVVKIKNNFIEIKSDLAPNLDKPAIITFRDLPEFADPVILKNSDICEEPECEALSPLNQSEVMIRVESWSNYSIGERPIEESNTIVEELSSSSGGGGGDCSTVWVCGEWSECSADGQQTRICVKEREFCEFVDERPAEVQACEIPGQVLETTQQQGAIARITGAVVGFGRESPGLVIVIFLALLAGVYAIAAFARRRYTKKK